MRPVSGEFPVTQGFGSLATRGVVGREYGSEVEHLVYLYGNYQPDGHNGADIGCPVGTPVYATRSGTVVLCDWDVNLPGDDSWSASGYFQRFAFFKRFGGRLLVVKVAPNDYDVYAHLSEWRVSYGQQVSVGQIVALSGASSAGKDNQLGPHLHTERIVDLTYPTSNGLIFGRTDPTTVWGGIAAMGGTITPLTEDDEMISQETQDWLRANLLNKDDGGQLRKDLGYQNDTLFSKADGAWQNGILADISTRLGNTLNKDDGGYIVGLLAALKPGATDAAAIADAVVAAVGKDIAGEVVTAIGAKLSGGK